jgi:phosphoglycolate phosphatase
MPNYTHILFDLDGTLTDSRPGISNSLKYALQQMKIDGYSEELMDRFIGPPLQDGFKNLFGLDELNANLGTAHFRTYFGDKGWHENEPYAGISELLEELHLSGKLVYVVTSKLEKYAQMIIQHFEFDKYINDLQGAEYSGKHSGKGQLIAQLMERNCILPSSSVVMIGDTHYDMIGATEQGISSIAVGYGFGTLETLTASNPNYIVDSVDDLAELLLG